MERMMQLKDLDVELNKSMKPVIEQNQANSYKKYTRTKYQDQK